MYKEFWLERWERKETGFHQDEFNTYLRQYWQIMPIDQRSMVFVPLCGKSRDMLWLHEQGHQILGVELSEIAVRSFYDESGYIPKHFTQERFELFEADEIRILHGDFFDLSKKDLEQVKAVYDRASLVALPPDMRERYTLHLASIVPSGTRVLLISFDYPQIEMQGPPFAVSTGEVESLYRDFAEVCLLSQIDVLAQNSRFQQRGLTRLYEYIFLLTLH